MGDPNPWLCYRENLQEMTITTKALAQLAEKEGG